MVFLLDIGDVRTGLNGLVGLIEIYNTLSSGDNISGRIMRSVATMWIRDGVLVNRMHVNPVAFAFSYWFFVPSEKKRSISLESLINFGFAKSGFSCAEKMVLFNTECGDLLEDIEAAASFYNLLATAAAKSCTYFDGAVQLLQDLHAAGAQNFITSAVEQNVLDAWAGSSRGSLIAPYLTEILGKRPNFLKGANHFEYVASRVGGEPIYYVADAESEISTARECSSQYNIVPIGFGYAIEKQQVMDAVQLVQKALSVCARDKMPHQTIDFGSVINRELLLIPDRVRVEESLRSAGASYVVTGDATEIIEDLRLYFE